MVALFYKSIGVRYCNVFFIVFFLILILFFLVFIFSSFLLFLFVFFIYIFFNYFFHVNHTKSCPLKGKRVAITDDSHGSSY